LELIVLGHLASMAYLVVALASMAYLVVASMASVVVLASMASFDPFVVVAFVAFSACYHLGFVDVDLLGCSFFGVALDLCSCFSHFG
jgi:hypothetical protein